MRGRPHRGAELRAMISTRRETSIGASRVAVSVDKYLTTVCLRQMLPVHSSALGSAASVEFAPKLQDLHSSTLASSSTDICGYALVLRVESVWRTLAADRHGASTVSAIQFVASKWSQTQLCLLL